MLRRDPQTGTLRRDFHDDYLELIRLLTEGSALEHALMITYLDALFALQPKYAAVRGDLSTRSYLEHAPGARGGTGQLQAKETFLDVAIEEMQHLALVNNLLCALGGAPNLTPQIWPLASDLYPFAIEPVPLTRCAVATWLWIEADACALSLPPAGGSACDGKREPPAFVAEVRRVLAEGQGIPIDRQPVNHIGSLYQQVITLLRTVSRNPPAFLPADFPWGEWELRLRWLATQGEVSHYRFFRRLFTGEAFGGDARVWQPGPAYPGRELVRKTAYPGQSDTIADPLARRVAWLADLHYWILLGVLDTAFRAGSLRERYVAIDQMTQALWHLGLHLAERFATALPFDPLGTSYALGRDEHGSLSIALAMLNEAEPLALALAAEGALPPGYDFALFPIARQGLERAGAVPEHSPKQPLPPRQPRP